MSIQSALHHMLADTCPCHAWQCGWGVISCCLQDMQRPLYMQPKDAIEYGICDGIVKNETAIIDTVKSRAQWDKDAGLVERPASGQ